MGTKQNKEVTNVLIQYKRTMNLIHDLSDQIGELDDRMTSIKTGKITGMPRGGVPLAVSDLVAEKVDLVQRKEKLEKIAEQKKEIVQAYIDTVLSPKHNRFLTLFFVKCLSMQEISRKEHYSRRHAFRIYAEALDMVDISLDL